MNFDVISGQTIADIVDRQHGRVIDIIRDAYSARHNGNTVNPDSYFLRFPKKPDARIIALPAHIDDDVKLSGIKWISSFPSNLERGIPRASAVLVLNDYETGYPLALMEASIISAARTAASAVLGAELLNGNDKSAQSLGIVGTGLISRYMLKFFMGNDWSFKRFNLFDLNDEYSRQFKQRMMDDFGIADDAIQIVESADDLIAQSHVVSLATTSAEPHIHDFDCFDHKPVVLHISLRDISADIILQSHNVVDDIDHCLKAATSPHLAEQKLGNRSFVHSTLPELIAGKAAPERDKPIIFSPFGMGILDLALGYFIYEQASANGQSTRIPGFFHEMTRI